MFVLADARRRQLSAAGSCVVAVWFQHALALRLWGMPACAVMPCVCPSFADPWDVHRTTLSGCSWCMLNAFGGVLMHVFVHTYAFSHADGWAVACMSVVCHTEASQTDASFVHRSTGSTGSAALCSPAPCCTARHQHRQQRGCFVRLTQFSNQHAIWLEQPAALAAAVAPRAAFCEVFGVGSVV